jgi:hypothetical protein
MIRKVAWVAFLGAIAVAGPQEKAAAPAAGSLPSAESILDHYVEVTGGKAAYEKRKNEVSTGTFEMTAQGIKGTMTIYSAPPDKSYTSIEIEGIGKVESGTSDGIAWEKNPMLGPRVKSGDEKADALREAIFNGEVNWRQLYTKAETTGVENINGEECYKVVLTPAQGKPMTAFFSKKSGLVVQRNVVAVTQMGETPAEMDLADYKSFDGVLTPTKMTQKVAGQEFTVTVQSVKINQDIPADKFDPPAEIKALLKK